MQMQIYTSIFVPGKPLSLSVIRFLANIAERVQSGIIELNCHDCANVNFQVMFSLELPSSLLKFPTKDET